MQEDKPATTVVRPDPMVAQWYSTDRCVSCNCHRLPPSAIVFSSKITGQMSYADVYTKSNYFTGERACDGLGLCWIFSRTRKLMGSQSPSLLLLLPPQDSRSSGED